MAKPVVSVITKKVTPIKFVNTLAKGEVAIWNTLPYMKVSIGGVVNLRTGEYFTSSTVRYREFRPADSAEFNIVE